MAITPRDVTARAEARSSPRERQNQHDHLYQSMFESAPVGLVRVGLRGDWQEVNPRLCEILGYSREDLEVADVGSLLQSECIPDKESLRKIEAGSLDRYALAERGFRRKDGSDVWTRINVSVHRDAEARPKHLIFVIEDITEARARDVDENGKNEEERRHLAAIVESSNDGIIGKNLDGTITSWNRAAEQILGYSAEEVVGQPISLLLPPGHANEEPAILERLMRGEFIASFDTVRRRKDGKDIYVSATISPVRDANGKVVGASKIVRDITDRRRTEEWLARANQAAEAANRDLESFSYAVAHDLRAPLRGMNGFAHVLLARYSDKLDADGQDWLKEIVLNAGRMGSLIDALLSLSRLTRTEPRRSLVDLSAIVRANAKQLSVAEPERAVDVIVEDGLTADLDPPLAQALISNLFANAWKFTSRATNARIEFGMTEREGTRTFFIRDNGAGFDMAYAEKLFGPFQRLHAVDEFPGTGIGLATVQRIVRRHGGRVWAEGVVHGGATFYFCFPEETSGAPK